MNKKAVLLADDDQDDVEIFKEALEIACPSNYFVHAPNGAEVFDYLSSSENIKPDIIFLDLNMPEMNGWQCLAKLKNTRAYENIPVIMYTTSSNPRDKQIALDLNAHGLITKPSNPKILERVLEAIICKIDSDDLRSAISDAYLITKGLEKL
jgi:CheY-like chemotaxis protein